MIHRHLVYALVLIGGLAAVESAHAIYDCAANPVLSTGNITMTEDWETNSATNSCITLQNGHDLNMAGHTITCTNATACAFAVTAVSNNSGSIVYGDGEIAGPFVVGVNGNSGIDEVRTLTIHGAETAISSTDFKQIHKNVIYDVLEGIAVGMNSSSTDIIENNYISLDPAGEGAGISAVTGGSGSGAKINKNYIENYKWGIYLGDSSNFRVTDNFIGAPGNGYVSPIYMVNATGKTLSGNLCADPTDCPTPVAPFVLP